MVNLIDRECCDALAEKFYKNAGAGLGKGNGYEQTILQPRLDELANKVKDIYPEYYQSFVNVREAFTSKVKSLYSTEEKKSAIQGAVVQNAAVQAK